MIQVACSKIDCREQVIGQCREDLVFFCAAHGGAGQCMTCYERGRARAAKDAWLRSQFAERQLALAEAARYEKALDSEACSLLAARARAVRAGKLGLLIVVLAAAFGTLFVTDWHERAAISLAEQRPEVQDTGFASPDRYAKALEQLYKGDVLGQAWQLWTFLAVGLAAPFLAWWATGLRRFRGHLRGDYDLQRAVDTQRLAERQRKQDATERLLMFLAIVTVVGLLFVFLGALGSNSHSHSDLDDD